MRMTTNMYGHSTMVSNEEYSVLKKIKARGKVPVQSINEYYSEVGEKLVSRGVLNKVQIEGTEYFVPIRNNNDKQ